MRNETLFRSFAKQLKTRSFVLSCFFSFAKRSKKLGETVTCFIQFCISREKKNYETVNPSCNPPYYYLLYINTVLWIRNYLFRIRIQL